MSDSSSAFFPDVMRCEFVIRFSSPAVLDDYPGAAWRSGLGAMLRPLWCCHLHTVNEDGSEPRPDCGCAFLSDWKTTTAWNPVALAKGVRGQGSAAAPRPYIIDPLHAGRAGFAAGDITRVRLTLVGEATARWDDWRRAFLHLGARGLGREYKSGKGRFTVEAILDGDGRTPLTARSGEELLCPPSLLKADALEKRVEALLAQGGNRRLTMAFLRPLQLRGKGREEAPPLLSFRVIWDKVTGRVQGLGDYCAGQDVWNAFNLKELSELAKQVYLADALLSEIQQQRVSRRSHYGVFQSVPANGDIGHLTFEADGGLLARFLPLLVVGEWFHIGAKCTTGLGAYRLVAG